MPINLLVFSKCGRIGHADRAVQRQNKTFLPHRPIPNSSLSGTSNPQKVKNQGKWVHIMEGLKTNGSYYEGIQTASVLPGDGLNPLDCSVDCFLRVYQRIVRKYQLQNELLFAS